MFNQKTDINREDTTSTEKKTFKEKFKLAALPAFIISAVLIVFGAALFWIGEEYYTDSYIVVGIVIAALSLISLLTVTELSVYFDFINMAKVKSIIKIADIISAVTAVVGFGFLILCAVGSETVAVCVFLTIVLLSVLTIVSSLLVLLISYIIERSSEKQKLKTDYEEKDFEMDGGKIERALGASKLKAAIVPYGVTEIGEEIFDERDLREYSGTSFTGIKSITIPDTVTKIGKDAFAGCSDLKEVKISSLEAWCKINFENGRSNPLKYARKLVLNGEVVNDLVIPDSIAELKNYVFYGLRLKSLYIPKDVKSISKTAFSDFYVLEKISVDSENEYYDSRDNCNAVIETKTDTLIQGCINTVIPEGVIKIGVLAFCNCSGLTSITIPDSVTSIGDRAFLGCESLTSITIPDSITSIDDWTFCGCSGLTSITIPDSITSIGNWTFSDCAGLSSITIPDSVTSIGDSAFRNCTGLTSITIPDSVTSIGFGAFEGCESLTSITVPDGVKSIDDFVFLRCSNLTAVYIPRSVNIISDCAFAVGSDSLCIYGAPGSYAEHYARSHGYNFQSYNTETNNTGDPYAKEINYVPDNVKDALLKTNAYFCVHVLKEHPGDKSAVYMSARDKQFLIDSNSFNPPQQIVMCNNIPGSGNVNDFETADELPLIIGADGILRVYSDFKEAAEAQPNLDIAIESLNTLFELIATDYRVKGVNLIGKLPGRTEHENRLLRDFNSEIVNYRRLKFTCLMRSSKIYLTPMCYDSEINKTVEPEPYLHFFPDCQRSGFNVNIPDLPRNFAPAQSSQGSMHIMTIGKGGKETIGIFSSYENMISLFGRNIRIAAITFREAFEFGTSNGVNLDGVVIDPNSENMIIVDNKGYVFR